MEMAANLQNFVITFIMRDKCVPNFVRQIEDTVTKNNLLRVKKGAIKPFKPTVHEPEHDTFAHCY